MALILTEGTKAYYKRQFWSFITLISQSKYKKTGDTYPMAYGWFMIGIYWTNEKWCMPTLPQICLLGYRILNSLTWLSRCSPQAFMLIAIGYNVDAYFSANLCVLYLHVCDRITHNTFEEINNRSTLYCVLLRLHVTYLYIQFRNNSLGMRRSDNPPPPIPWAAQIAKFMGPT